MCGCCAQRDSLWLELLVFLLTTFWVCCGLWWCLCFDAALWVHPLFFRLGVPIMSGGLSGVLGLVIARRFFFPLRNLLTLSSPMRVFAGTFPVRLGSLVCSSPCVAMNGPTHICVPSVGDICMPNSPTSPSVSISTYDQCSLLFPPIYLSGLLVFLIWLLDELSSVFRR